MLITCPRCEEEQDVLAFKQLEQPARFRKLLNPILKCLACKHVFSPRIFS